MVHHDRGEELAEEHQRRQRPKNSNMEFIGTDRPGEFNSRRGRRELGVRCGQATRGNYRALGR